MFTIIYSNSRKLFPIAFIAFALTILASCSSSNQLVSSFSKRKYTNGHFSDPAAKLNTSKKPGNSRLIENVVKQTVINSNLLTQNQEEYIKVNFGHPVKSNFVKKDNPASRYLRTLKKTAFTITQSSASNSTNSNVSLKETPTIQDSPSYSDHGGNDGGGHYHHHYLLDCLLCVLLWLIFIILAAASVVSGSGAGLGLFAILAYIAAIAALVFFILWIVDLAS